VFFKSQKLMTQRMAEDIYISQTHAMISTMAWPQLPQLLLVQLGSKPVSMEEQ